MVCDQIHYPNNYLDSFPYIEHLDHYIVLTMADIGLDMARDHLCGVDPRLTNAFVAADSSGNMLHKICKTSTREFYHISGWIKATHQCQRLKKVNPVIQAIEDGMPLSKTASTTIFDAYAVYVLEHYGELSTFYDNRWREM